jgi:lambda family phage portal protein
MMTDSSLGYEGASTAFRLARKGLLTGTADQIAARDLRFLWARSHHLCRNNPMAITAKHRLQAHWIGQGIKVRWNNKKLQKLWDEFTADPNLDGFGNLYNTQNLWAGALFESGESLTRMVIHKGAGVVPLKLQPIEAEYLDPQFHQHPTTKFGIEFTDFGRPKNYHFWQRHPQEIGFATGIKRIPVPAEDVLHILQRERPGQWRGVPHLTSVLLNIYEIDELIDATLVRQKAAQAIGWIIKKRESGPLPLVGGFSTDPIPMSSEDASGKRKKIQKVLPGGIHYLEDDEDFTFASVDDIGPNLLVLLKDQGHIIASGLDITYEQLTGDLSGVNFSSIRAGLIEFRRRVGVVQQLILINLALQPLAKRFQELASIYGGQNFSSATCKFVLPKVDWVDPYKDIQADVLEIQAGLATLKEKLDERGIEDFDTHVAQLAEEQKLDVVLVSNPKSKQTAAKSKAPQATADSATPATTD